ncbi:MAG: hypothetical protein P4L84_16025 [Isosphaeraceae bacterium]|nr:hypothetical protein [Isosphaeraceae bacterium]
MTLNTVLLILAVVAIVGAIFYASSTPKTGAPKVERIPANQRERFVSLETLIEDHLDLEDERVEMRRQSAIRAAKKARAREAAKRLAGDPEGDGPASPK